MIRAKQTSVFSCYYEFIYSEHAQKPWYVLLKNEIKYEHSFSTTKMKQIMEECSTSVACKSCYLHSYQYVVRVPTLKFKSKPADSRT
jgi:hypothetical protein